jgi:hypothetical protein
MLKQYVFVNDELLPLFQNADELQDRFDSETVYRMCHK